MNPPAGTLVGVECAARSDPCRFFSRVQHPVAFCAERVATNLDLMAGLPGLSPELRTICRRLAQRWQAIQDDARWRAAGKPARDLRSFR